MTCEMLHIMERILSLGGYGGARLGRVLSPWSQRRLTLFRLRLGVARCPAVLAISRL